MNSAAVALVITAVLVYGIMCINHKMELPDALTASLAVFLAAFCVFGGGLKMLGDFSLNKTLAVILAVSILAAVVMRLIGRKPGGLLKSSESKAKLFIRAALLLGLSSALYALLSYPWEAGQPDALSAAMQLFDQYLWRVMGIALGMLVLVDLFVHFAGYTKAERIAQKCFPVLAIAGVLAAVIIVLWTAASAGGKGGIIAAGCVLAVALALFGLAGLYRERDFIELVMLAVSETVMGYLLSAGVLIGINRFSIGKAVVGTLLLILVLDSIIYAVKRQRPKIAFVWKRNLVGLLFCLAVVPLGFSTFGLFGMGQDEGVYQAKAIGYIYGNNDNYMSFPEYDKIVLSEEKSGYMRNLGNNLEGYNFALDEEHTERASQEIVQNDTLGNLHGVHTFSALLGLYGLVAGVGNMLQLGTWIFVLSLFLLWLTLGNLGIRTVYKSIAMLVYAVSPQILWQARTSLVETTLAFLILVFLYLITDYRNKEYRWLFCIPVVVFSFFHITIYVFMPLFVLIAFGMYFATAKRRYIASALVCITGYLAGFYMMYTSSLTYVYGNYDRLYIGPVRPSNIREFVTAVCAAAVLLCIVLAVIPVKRRRKTRRQEKRMCRILWRLCVTAFVGVGITGCAYAALKTTYPFAYLTSYAYLLSSGLFLLPAVLLAAVIRPDWLKKDSSIVVLSAMFYYCVILYSAVFKKEVVYYYYYGRYIVPYLSIIVVLGVYVLQRFADELPEQAKVFSRSGIEAFSVLAAMLAAVVLMPYTAVVTTQQDETEMQWEVLTGLADIVQEDSAVILEEGMVPQLMLSLKYMTGNDIYILQQDIKTQYETLQMQYAHVYLVTGEETDGVLPEHMDSIYHNNNKIQTDVKMPERMSGIKAFIPYAEEFVSGFRPVAVYEYLSES